MSSKVDKQKTTPLTLVTLKRNSAQAHVHFIGLHTSSQSGRAAMPRRARRSSGGGALLLGDARTDLDAAAAAAAFPGLLARSPPAWLQPIRRKLLQGLAWRRPSRRTEGATLGAPKEPEVAPRPDGRQVRAPLQVPNPKALLAHLPRLAGWPKRQRSRGSPRPLARSLCASPFGEKTKLQGASPSFVVLA